MSSDSENLLVLILINSSCCPKKQNKKSKIPKSIWMKP